MLIDDINWISAGGILHEQTRILSVLRNPHGFSEEVVRAARNMAADRLEEKDRDFESIFAWCENNGLNPTATVNGRQ